MKDCSALSDAEVVVSEGTRAYYITSGTSTRIAVLYHGNGESACNSAYLAHWLSVRGYNVLAVEYSGYAGDPSSPSVQLLIGDVEHIQTWLEKMNFSDTLIVGRSVGTGFASYHAKLSSPDKLCSFHHSIHFPMLLLCISHCIRLHS